MALRGHANFPERPNLRVRGNLLTDGLQFAEIFLVHLHNFLLSVLSAHPQCIDLRLAGLPDLIRRAAAEGGVELAGLVGLRNFLFLSFITFYTLQKFVNPLNKLSLWDNVIRLMTRPNNKAAQGLKPCAALTTPAKLETISARRKF